MIPQNIIFHCPFPLDYNAKSASGIRPVKMLKAFIDLGYNVDLVVGSSSERKYAINLIKKKIKTGYKYIFAYSESSTMPTALTDVHHLTLNPLLDFNFFNFLKRNNIKLGLFYRDIHWKFNHYGINLPWYKKQLALFFYYFDLKIYNKYVDILYLPSMEMAKYIDYVENKKVLTLPPAHDLYDFNHTKILNGTLKLLYVGGVSEGYKLNYLFEALSLSPQIQLVVCTRKDDWDKNKSEYGEIPKNIKIVHESGNGLEELYNQADIGILFVEPKDYWEFAVPFKLYEYIGRNKPIICSNNSLVGKIVESNQIGWAVDYDVDCLVNFLINLGSTEIETKLTNVLAIRMNETWISRAQQVSNDLLKFD